MMTKLTEYSCQSQDFLHLSYILLNSIAVGTVASELKIADVTVFYFRA